MADKTGIGWTEATWNPTTGCDKVSPGCGLPRFDADATGGCYAMALAKRLKAMGQAKYQNDGDPRTSGPGFGLTLHEDALEIPLHWRLPRKVFVNSMSDLGHARVRREFLARVWAVMAQTPQHTYQILSKRPDRIRAALTDECRCGGGHTPGTHFRSAMEWAATSHSPTYVPGLKPGVFYDPWPLPNVIIGTSIELDRYCPRADEVRHTPAAVTFLSLEPLLGPLPSLNLDGISWIIIGGESGPDHRPMSIGWLEDIVAKARTADVPVFVKQDSGPRPGHQGRIPDALWLKEFPAPPLAGAA